jgi:hypothetical protein
MRDILDSAKVVTRYIGIEFNCLSDLRIEIAHVRDETDRISDLISLSIDMQSATDERTVNSMIKTVAKNLIGSIALAKRGAAELAASCSNSAVGAAVNQYAARFAPIADNATAELQSIQSRLGR